MIRTNNQYIKEDNIERIRQINVITNKTNKTFEEIDITEENPNVAIIYGVNNKKENLSNLYWSVKTIIIDDVIFKNNFEEIINSEIENIIIYNKIYKNTRDRFEYMDIIDDNEEKWMILNKKIDEGKYKEMNSNGSSVIYYLCDMMRYREVNKILDEIKDEEIKEIKEIINKINNDMKSIIEVICDKDNEFSDYEEFKKLIKRIIKITDREIVNIIKDNGINNLITLCYRGTGEIVNELLDENYFDDKILYSNNLGITALYMATYNYLEDTAIKIIEKIKDIENKKNLINTKMNGKSILELSLYRKLKKLPPILKYYTE
jgi:hypothetical protein